MTKTQRNQLHWALTDAKETILALTDGSASAKREARDDSPLVVDKLNTCLAILHTSET